jgi:hypothetical protein
MGLMNEVPPGILDNLEAALRSVTGEAKTYSLYALPNEALGITDLANI